MSSCQHAGTLGWGWKGDSNKLSLDNTMKGLTWWLQRQNPPSLPNSSAMIVMMGRGRRDKWRLKENERSSFKISKVVFPIDNGRHRVCDHLVGSTTYRNLPYIKISETEIVRYIGQPVMPKIPNKYIRSQECVGPSRGIRGIIGQLILLYNQPLQNHKLFLLLCIISPSLSIFR